MVSVKILHAYFGSQMHLYIIIKLTFFSPTMSSRHYHHFKAKLNIIIVINALYIIQYMNKTCDKFIYFAFNS